MDQRPRTILNTISRMSIIPKVSRTLFPLKVDMEQNVWVLSWQRDSFYLQLFVWSPRGKRIFLLVSSEKMWSYNSFRQPAISIWLGDVATKNATTEYKTSNSIPIEDIILHPDYEENSFFRNVGLIRLTRDIQFNSRRFPACLEFKYGNSVEMASLSNYDQVQEQISITDHGTCNDYFDMRDILESEQFCAKVQNNCAFPTGSPLQRKHEVLDKIYTVIGIVSIRKDCKMTESQLVFSNVTYFIDWIEQVLAPH